MEKKTVQQVFSQSPNEDAEKDEQRYIKRNNTYFNRTGNEPARNWYPHGWNDPPRRAREQLEFLTASIMASIWFHYYNNNKNKNKNVPLKIRFGKSEDLPCLL